MIKNKQKITPYYTGNELIQSFSVKNLRYIITGTGRCGTVYAAKLFSSIGIPCGHESVFCGEDRETLQKRLLGEKPCSISDMGKWSSEFDEKKSIHWFMDENVFLQADSSYMALPFLDDPLLKRATIIHLVRHPFKVINAFVEGLGFFKERIDWTEPIRRYHQFIYDQIPQLYEKMHPTARAALYYMRWNQLIEEKSKNHTYYRHCIEDPIKNLFTFLGEKPDYYYTNPLCNHIWEMKNKYTSMKDLFLSKQLADELMAFINRYYKIKKKCSLL